MRLCAGMPGAMLHALHRAHRHAVQTAASSVGLEDLGSPMILMILQDWEADQEPPTQRELADAFHVTPATVAVSLKSLERGGYVAKTADSRDQRCKRVTITEKGCGAVETYRRIFEWLDRKMLEDFSLEEREQLSAYHLRMLDNIKKAGFDLDNPFERMGCKCSKP